MTFLARRSGEFIGKTKIMCHQKVGIFKLPGKRVDLKTTPPTEKLPPELIENNDGRLTLSGPARSYMNYFNSKSV